MSKETILYIDDEESNLLVFKVAFHNEYNILTTTSIEKAWELILKYEIKVFISDLCMPDKSGISVLKKIKRNFPEVVCLIITAYPNHSEIINSANMNLVFNIIRKPWSEDYMRKNLQKAFEKYNASFLK